MTRHPGWTEGDGGAVEMLRQVSGPRRDIPRVHLFECGADIAFVRHHPQTQTSRLPIPYTPRHAICTSEISSVSIDACQKPIFDSIQRSYASAPTCLSLSPGDPAKDPSVLLVGRGAITSTRPTSLRLPQHRGVRYRDLLVDLDAGCMRSGVQVGRLSPSYGFAADGLAEIV